MVISESFIGEQNYQTISKQIQMKSQPRGQYHPRNAKECSKVTHFIRCEEGESKEYPTIYVCCCLISDKSMLSFSISR